MRHELAAGPDQVPAPLNAPEWRPPFYIRWRLLSLSALALSAAWLGLSAQYILAQIRPEDLTQLLPHELGGMAAGVLTPLALLWMVVAFYDRAKIYQSEARALRWHLQSITYPSREAEARVSEISDTLRAQAWSR